MSWTFTILLIAFLVFVTFPIWIQPIQRWADRKLKELEAKEAEAQARQ